MPKRSFKKNNMAKFRQNSEVAKTKNCQLANFTDDYVLIEDFRKKCN